MEGFALYDKVEADRKARESLETCINRRGMERYNGIFKRLCSEHGEQNVLDLFTMPRDGIVWQHHSKTGRYTLPDDDIRRVLGESASRLRGLLEWIAVDTAKVFS